MDYRGPGFLAIVWFSSFPLDYVLYDYVLNDREKRVRKLKRKRQEPYLHDN